MNIFDQSEFDNIYHEIFGEYPTRDNFPCVEFTPLGTGQESLGQEIDRLVEQLQENDPKNEKSLVAETLHKNDEVFDLELIPLDDNQIMTENYLEQKQTNKRTYEYEKKGDESFDSAVGYQPLIETFSPNKKRKIVETRSVETQTSILYCFFCLQKDQKKIAIANGVCGCNVEIPVCLRHIQTRPRTPHFFKPCSKQRIYKFEEIHSKSQNQRMLSDYEHTNQDKENIQPNY